MQSLEPLPYLMLTSGFLGGFGHCIGMCGPIVVSYSIQLAAHGHRGASSIWHILLYNLGRITTYSVIGGIMGLTGSFVATADVLARHQRTVMATLGLVMIVIALAVGGFVPFLKLRRPFSCANSERSFINRVVAFIMGQGSPAAFYPIGIVLGFLPCGLLYTALIAAAGAGFDAGNPVRGLIKGTFLLLLFGIGTVPSLFIVGQLASSASSLLRGWLYRASALAMAIVGSLLLYKALSMD